MRTNSVTGAFAVLNTQTFPQELSESLQLPGLYLRDRDPSAHTSAGNGDLLLERAPLELVRGLGIAMDSNWRPMFVLEGDTARADACLIRPCTTRRWRTRPLAGKMRAIGLRRTR